ncbi:MAG: enoyl-CoA hydratase/isomerase family protein [Caulobacteraceae bacterium]|nr:enoyl-CoA hydratase/isomerase family protein [Caulobacteraceae bacterium]
MSEYVHYEVGDDFIATITLDKPARRNALDDEMGDALEAALAAAGEDDKVRVVILTGAGGAFSSGRDLVDLANRPPEKRGRTRENVAEGGFWFVTACPKPVVAAVDGPAVGWGVEISSHCDVRIASDSARFGWVFAHRGLVTDTAAGTWILPRIVGFAEAARLLYSGEIIDAAEALRIGYVQAVVPRKDLMAAARAEAARFAKGSPFAIRRLKRLLWGGPSQSALEHYQANREALFECFLSADHKEGVAAFLEKRPAVFTGR